MNNDIKIIKEHARNTGEVPKEYVCKAIEVCDNIGIKEFLKRHKKREPKRYFLSWNEGKLGRYPLKPIWREACQIFDEDYPDTRVRRRLLGGFMHPNSIGRMLAKIGFTIVDLENNSTYSIKSINGSMHEFNMGGAEEIISLSQAQELTKGYQESQLRLALLGTAPVTPTLTEILLRPRRNIVKAIVLARAKGICESCHSPAPFWTRQGNPYLEVHHLDRLADDGADHPVNAGAVCPTCHRRIHCGDDGGKLNEALRNVVHEKEAGRAPAD